MNNNNSIEARAPDSPESALVATQTSREIQEVQAAMIIAKRFPRDQVAATDRIQNACRRPTLAEGAMYQYSRGGSDISGPSIRLAESLAQNWGNLQFGIRELDKRDGVSTVEAFAWDIETNTREVKVFQVPHDRYTRKGGRQRVYDPRDIYEIVANQGARRLRACILGIIPGDVVDMAVTECEKTLATHIDCSEKSCRKMLESFGRYGVTQRMIEKRIQRRIDTITPALMAGLIKIGTSLRDGMSSSSDWFEPPSEPKPLTPATKPPGTKPPGTRNDTPDATDATETPVKEPEVKEPEVKEAQETATETEPTQPVVDSHSDFLNF